MSRRKVALLLLGGVVLVPLGALGVRSPSMDRAWASDMELLAGAEVTEHGLVHLENVRDWTYGRDTVLSMDYLEATYDPADLQEIWLYEQEFDERGLIAHTFLVFQFDASQDGPRYLGLSMEARREQDEPYSILRGIFRGFEASLIWATEEDLVTRRVTYAGDPVIRYRLQMSPEARATIFVNMVKETQSLEAEPRWYNTIFYNCTSSLIRYANEAQPGAIPLHPSWVLTGRIDEYLERLGYLDPTATRTLTAATLARDGLR
jgi:hypothetical protein